MTALKRHVDATAACRNPAYVTCCDDRRDGDAMSLPAEWIAHTHTTPIEQVIDQRGCASCSSTAFAADRFLREGRRVRPAIPPEVGSDFNDVLSFAAPADVGGEARHVA